MRRLTYDWRSARLAIVSMAAFACSSATEPVQTPDVLEDAVLTKVEPPGDASPLVGVALAASPYVLAVDGSFGEWGTLPQLPASLPAPVSRTGVDPVEPTRDNPHDAQSRVFAALHPEGAALAIELRDAEEVWVGIGSAPAELPVLGEYFGRMGFVPTNCLTSPRVESYEGTDEQGYWMEKNPPEVVAACESMLARVAEQHAVHNQRFERWFRIDTRGVTALHPDGTSRPLEGARVVAGAGDAPRKLEVALPLAALPRFAEAPVTLLRLAASTQPPTSLRLNPEAWVWLKPPRQVAFGPHASLLTHAFERANDVGEFPVFTTVFQQPRGLSYHPANPNALEVVDSRLCTDRTAKELPLYTVIATELLVEVGVVAGPRGSQCETEVEPWIAIQHEGTVTDVVAVKGTLRETVNRNGEIHVISSKSAGWEPTAATFSVIAIAQDGSHREAVVPLDGLTTSDPIEYWSAPEVFSSAAHESFGWRAARGTQVVTATFRWDAAKKQYVGSWKAKPAIKQTRHR